ncbi:hypothetical protein MC885_002321 [Smutsia gigantea]|nr:hypothetical protein MC885_002321 [Smutsia gigantea]
MNTSVGLHVPPACIVEHCDSVSLCLSEGLGAPAGALVGGPKHFIEEARRLRKALGLQELVSPICSVDLPTVETNMAMVQVDGMAPKELCQRLQIVSAEEVAQTGQAVRVLLFPWMERSVHTVWHCNISAQDTELVLRQQGP